MAPQPMENSTLNGSFLVLDLGNNTVGLGNSSAFPVASNSFNQNTVESTPNLDAVSKRDTLSNSTEEASSASESQKGKRISREMEDPDWVPEKVRKSSSSASRAARPKQGPLAGKNTSMIPPIGDNSMFGSKSGPLPPYLVNLLHFFGWRVVFQPGFGDYIYISANGIAYYSLPKAFEAFLNDTSKYEDKACSASQYWENGRLDGTFVGGLSASNVGLHSGAVASGNSIAGLPASDMPLQSGVACEGSGKKSIKTKDSTNIENVEPGMTSNVGLQSGAAAAGNSIEGLPASNMPLQSGVACEGSGQKSIGTKDSTNRENVEPGMMSNVGLQSGATADGNSIAGLYASKITLQSGVAAGGSGKKSIRTKDSTIRENVEPGMTSNVGLQGGATADGNSIAGLPASKISLQSGVAAGGSGKKGESIRTRDSTIREKVEPGMRSDVGLQSGATADGNSIAGLPARKITLQSGGAAGGSGKKGKSIKTKNCTRRGNVQPETTIENPPQLKQYSVYTIGKDSSNMPSTVVSEGANQVVSSSTVDEKTKSHVEDRCLDSEPKQMAGSCSLTIENDMPSTNGMCQDEKLLEVRNSIRISGRHVPLECKVDNAETNSNCSYLSTCRVSGNAVNAVRGKEKQKFKTSQAKIVLDNMPEVCIIDQSSNNEVRKSKCSSMVATRHTHSSTTCMEKDSQVVGVRRSRHVNKKNVLVDPELHAELMVENNLASSISVVNAAARKKKGKSLVSESVIDEKMHFSMTDKSSGSEAQKLNCSNAILSHQTDASDMHQSGDVLGVRRSVRINRKHVHVDGELDAERGVDDIFSDLSKFAANTELITNFSRLNDKEGRSPESNNMRLKQTNSKRSDIQRFRTHIQVESHDSRKGDMGKNPGPGKSPAFQKEIEVAKRKPAGGGNLDTKQKKKRSCGCSLIVRRNGKDDHHEEISPRTKLTILSWLIDFGILTENEKVVYISQNSVGNIPNGLVTRGGIWCDRCKEVEPLSKFKAHAGSNLDLPWDNIFLMSGKTLTQCLREFWEKEKKRNKVGFQTVGTVSPDPSDDMCGVCADGGCLICCDNCPSTFHQDCVMLKALPEGIWYCPYCRCAFCMVAEHGSKRVPNTSALLLCKQCRRKYHQQCAWGNDIREIGSVSNSFCGKTCKKLATQLSDMLGVSNSMEGGFSWTLFKCLNEDEGVSSHERLPFIMEGNVKLSMALSVLNECFVPLMDQRTGVDVICQAVYNRGSNFNRLNYEGFHTLILEKDEEIISVASLRFHGTNLVEMPFVGTRPIYQRQGMCHRLLKATEDMLSSLCIKKLIIPAIPDLLEMWMKSFSFKPLEPSFKDEIRNLSMVVFARTNLLQKSICNTKAVDPEDMQTDNSISHGKNTKKNDELPSTFNEHSKTGGFVAGDQGWCSYNTEGPKDDIPDPWRMNADLSEIQYPKVPNGSVFDSLPAYDSSMTNPETLPQRLSSTPLSFPPVNMVLDPNPLGTGIISTPDGQQNSWLQSANEARDAQYDAVAGTLSFENFIRMKS